MYFSCEIKDFVSCVAIFCFVILLCTLAKELILTFNSLYCRACFEQRIAKTEWCEGVRNYMVRDY